MISARTDGVKFSPTMSAAIGMMTDRTIYVFERYSQLYGIKCAPNIMVITMSIFSGMVGYIHMAIKRYSIWFAENKMPRLVNGLPLL